MADNNDITPVSGELLPATSKLSEITKDLMVANSSFEKSVIRVEKNLTPELTVELDDPIFRSMEMSLTQIQDGIRALVDGLLSSFFTINQNHIQSIAIQREMVDVADDQLGLDQEKFTYQQEQDQTKKQSEETAEGDKAEAAREKSKSFGANFAKDIEEANKELEEKGFATYVADLMGFGGTIRGISETVAKIVPVLTLIKTSLLTNLTSLYTSLIDFGKTSLTKIKVAIVSVRTAYLGLQTKVLAGLQNIAASLMKFVTGVADKVVKAVVFLRKAYLLVQAKVLTGLSGIGAALMSFVTNPIGTIVKAVQFLSYAMTALTATTLATLGAIGTAIMGFVTGVLVPGLAAIGAALAPILLPAAAIIGVALYVYKWIEGFIAGFKDSAPDDGLLTKIFNGLLGAVKEVFKLTLGWPLELIKRLVAWIAGALGFTEFQQMLDNISFLEFFDTIFDKLKGVVNIITKAIENFFTNLGDEISTFFSGLFDFSKIKLMLTNLFAEIGVPRIEFDVPVIGKVGFGPFYPFMPDTNVANVKSSDSLETVSTGPDGSIDTREWTSQEGITVVEGAMTEGEYARGARSGFITKESIDATSGEEITTNNDKKVIGEFDTETGEGIIRYQATNADNELNNVMQEYKVTGVTFGQVRRLVDAGASPDEVRMFLENKQKSIFDKIGDFFSSPAETAPVEVAPAGAKRVEIAQELGTQTAAREEAKADQQSRQSVNMVDASTSNVSNISQSSVIMDTPSAVDGLSLSY